jgi:hypothetical protein
MRGLKFTGSCDIPMTILPAGAGFVSAITGDAISPGEIKTDALPANRLRVCRRVISVALMVSLDFMIFPFY